MPSATKQGDLQLSRPLPPINVKLTQTIKNVSVLLRPKTRIVVKHTAKFHVLRHEKRWKS